MTECRVPFQYQINKLIISQTKPKESGLVLILKVFGWQSSTNIKKGDSEGRKNFMFWTKYDIFQYLPQIMCFTAYENHYVDSLDFKLMEYYGHRLIKTRNICSRNCIYHTTYVVTHLYYMHIHWLSFIKTCIRLFSYKADISLKKNQMVN